MFNQQSSLFGANNSAAQKPSLFGGAQTSQAPQQSLFGGAGQQPQQQTSTGLFGQNQGTFSQGAPGGTPSLFGGQQQAQGQPQASTGSLFGGAQQSPTFGQNKPAGQGSLFGGQASTGLFGQNQGAAGQPNQPSLFGTQNQGAIGGASTSVFGQQPNAASGFNNPATTTGGFNSIAQASTSFFTNQQQPAGGASTGLFNSGGLGGNNPAQPQNSIFGQQNQQQQSNSLFGPQSGFSQPQTQTGLFNNQGAQQQTQGGFSALAGQTTAPGQSTSLFNSGGAQSGFTQNSGLTGGFMNQGGMGVGLNQPAQIYVNQVEYSMNLTSRQFKYNPEVVMVVDKARDPHPHLAIQNIRGDKNFKHVSNEMLRIFDMQSAKGIQVQNYEYLAMMKFKQDSAQYRHADKLNKLAIERAKNAANDPQSTQQQNQSNFSSLVQGTTSSFNQQQQPQSNFSTGLFNTNNSAPKLNLFGPQTTQPQQQTQGTSLFNTNPLQPGQQQQPQQNSLFGPSSGQPQQQQQSQFQSLFNTGANQATNPLQQNQQSSLFNQQPQQQNSATPGAPSLFNTQQPANQQQTSLFGPKPTDQKQNSLFQTPGLNGNPQQQTQQQPGQQSSLFAQPAGQSNSLFANNQNKPASSLFSQPQNTQQTSLFSTQTPASQGQSSLFNNQQPQAQKSLFSTGTSQPQQQNSLFSTQQNPQQNSLFSQPQGLQQTTTTPGQTSLFNNPGQQKPQTSLFAQPSGQQTSSLFSTVAPSINNLFNINNTNTTPGQNELFQNQNQNQMVTPQTTNLMSIYKSEDPFKVSTGFLKEPSPLENVQKEIESLKKQAQAISSGKFTKQDDDLNLQSLSNDALTYRVQTPDFQISIQLNQQNMDKTFIEEQERQRAKLKAMYERNGDSYRSEQKQRLNESMSTQYSHGYKDLHSLTQIHKGMVPQLYAPKTENPVSRYLMSQKEEQKEQRERDSLLRPKDSQKESVQPKLVKSADILTITANYKGQKDQNEQCEINIHKDRDVNDVVQRVKKWLVKECLVNPDLCEKMHLRFKNKALDEKKSLKDEEIVTDSKIFVSIGDEPQMVEQGLASQQVQEQDLKFTSQVSIEEEKEQIQFPKAPKEGYQTSPDFEEILKMKPEDLLKLENFVVSNQHGSIKFLDQTDISGVDLAQVVSISKGNAEVYDDTLKETNKPPVGQKLNKPALISLFNIKPRKNQTSIQMEEFLTKILEQSDAEHISYDSESHVWEFKVEHFTRYGFQDEESEDEEEMEGVDQQSQEEQVQMIKTGDREQQVRAEMDTKMDAPFESLSKKRDMIFKATKKDQQVDSYLDNEGHQNQKRRLLESDSEMSQYRNSKVKFNQITSIGQRGSEQRERIEENRLAQKIKQRIRERENAIAKADISNCKRPNDAETAAFLASFGVRSPQISLPRTRKAKPSFGPNGEILFVSSSNQIRVVQTNVVQNSQFQPERLILKYMSIQGSQISDSLNRMSLNPSIQESLIGDQQMEDLGEERIITLRNAIDDSFFSKLLQQRLPKSIMFCSDSINSKLPLNHFLCDIAFDLAKEHETAKVKSYKDQVKYEFFCFCLMNALFGNPKIHLSQLYSQYRGAKTLTRDMANFQSFQIKDENEPESQRLRKNALIEVLRVYCQQEFPVPNDSPFQGASESQIYAKVSQMILNGDIVDAVKVLRVNKMSKLALIVASRASRGQNREKFGLYAHHSLIQQAQRQGKRELVKLLTIISQDDSIEKSNSLGVAWEQDLLQTLLYSTTPDESLSAIILDKEKANSYQDQGQPSLLRSLTRLYANVDRCEDHFKTFNNQLTPSHDLTDYRLRYLVQLCLREYIKTTILPQNNLQCRSQFFIEEPYFCDTISKYTAQLVAKNQWKTALVITMTLPQNLTEIKSKLLVQIINSRGMVLVLKNKYDHDFVSKTLQLPVNLIQTSLALCYQTNNDKDRAIEEWLSAENYEQAHHLFYTRVLPLLMKRSIDLGLEKALQLTKEEQNVKANWIEQTQIGKNSQSLETYLNLFEQKQSKICKYEVQAGLVHSFLKLIASFKVKMHGDSQQTSQTLNSIQSLIEKCTDLQDPVHEFILGQLRTIGAHLSIYASTLERQPGCQNLHLQVANLPTSEHDIQKNKSKAAREAEAVTSGQLFATCTSAANKNSA